MLLACFLTRCKAGINIAMRIAMMAMTTSNSINVKPFSLCNVFALAFQREITSFVSMLLYNYYNTNSHGDTSNRTEDYRDGG